jgi:hypothetical protein
MTRVKLENSGEKYYTSIYPANEQLQIYNNNHTLWKTITLPTDTSVLSNAVETVSSISESKINSDALLEVVYDYSTGLLALGLEYSSRIINENGEILLDAQYVRNLRLNEINGLANKIFGTSFSYDRYVTSQGLVYSIGNLSTPKFGKKDTVIITPNPAKSFIDVNDLKSPITKVTIYNINGTIVKRENGTFLTKIFIDELPTGIYIVNLTDFKNQKTTHKITISR